MSRKRKQGDRDAATGHDEDTVSIDENIDGSDAINDAINDAISDANSNANSNANNAHDDVVNNADSADSNAVTDVDNAVSNAVIVPAGDSEPIVDDSISGDAEDEIHREIDRVMSRAVVRDGVMTITADMLESIDKVTNDVVMREFLRDDLRDTLAEVHGDHDDPDDDPDDDSDEYDARFLGIGDELVSRLSTSKNQRGAYPAASKNIRVLREELRKSVSKFHALRKTMRVVDASILGSMASEDARSDDSKLSIIDSSLADSDSMVARSVDNVIKNAMLSLDKCRIRVMAIMSVMIGLKQWYLMDESVDHRVHRVFNALDSELDDADRMEKLFFRDVNLVLLDKKIAKMRHLLRMTPGAFPELIDQEIVDIIIAGPINNDDKDYPIVFDHDIDYRSGLKDDPVLIEKITDGWVSILHGDDKISIPIEYEDLIWEDWVNEGFEPGVRSMIINDALNDEIGALTGIQVDNPNDDYRDYLYEDDADSTSNIDGTGLDDSHTNVSDDEDK